MGFLGPSVISDTVLAYLRNDIVDYIEYLILVTTKKVYDQRNDMIFVWFS